MPGILRVLWPVAAPSQQGEKAASGRPRRKPRQWERWGLQPFVFDFAESQIAEPFEFFSVDREKPFGDSHLKEALRGVKPHQPDTWLLLKGPRVITCELKATGKPRPEQETYGEKLVALGVVWFWTRSVTGYGDGLSHFGVRLKRNWHVVAEDFDLRLKARRDREMARRKAEARQGSLRIPP